MKFSVKEKENFNRGSTLVTVVVVVAFMSILATIILYLAGENFKTKTIDQKTKDSFYDAEVVVEQMRTQLAYKVAKASKEAYTLSSVDYIQNGNKYIREELFLRNFWNDFNSDWKDDWFVGDDIDYVNGLVSLFFATEYNPEADPEADPENPKPKNYIKRDSINKSGDSVEFDIYINNVKYSCKLNNFLFESIYDYTDDKSDKVFGSGRVLLPGSSYDPSDVSRFYVNDIDLTVTNSKGYVSRIVTSFEITPPMLNWGDTIENSSNNINYMECVRYYHWNKE